MSTDAIKKACEYVGSQAELARQLGISPVTVHQWITGERPIPTGRCVAIEQATQGAITRKDLRPDDWAQIWPELIDAA